MAESKLPYQTILMTADTVGGVWTYALELIQALESYGIQVHLATMGEKASPAQRKQAAGISNLHLHESDFQLEWMDNPWEEIDAAGQWLLQLEKQLEPDLIHLNNYCHGQLSWKAPVLIVGHSCVLSWWQAVKGESAPERYETYAQRVKEGLQAADVVVAPTRSYLGSLQSQYGPLAVTRVIPNGRRSSLFRPAPKEDFIFSMGRLWDEAKNIKACALAAEKLPWPLKVAGENKHPGNGKSQGYSQLDLLGQLSGEEVADLLSRAAVYTMPAKYEPFGLSVLEAAFSGCALVLGDIPSLKENWKDAALFADPDKPEDLYEKLEYLIKNPEERKKMGQKALQKAADFSSRNKGTAYANLYRQMMENAGQQDISDFSFRKSIMTDS